MENIKKGETSWGKIILALIFFWPIGVVLLYFKLVHKGGRLKAKVTFLVGLSAFCYLGVVAMISALPGTSSSEIGSILIAILFYLVGGVVATIFAKKSIKKYKYYKKYVDYMSVRRVVSIDELAGNMGGNSETVVEDVTKVFEYELIDGYINGDNEIIILPKNMRNNEFGYTIPEKKQVVTIKCKNCGATNKFVQGKDNRCEYCDSLLMNE